MKKTLNIKDSVKNLKNNLNHFKETTVKSYKMIKSYKYNEVILSLISILIIVTYIYNKGLELNGEKATKRINNQYVLSWVLKYRNSKPIINEIKESLKDNILTNNEYLHILEKIKKEKIKNELEKPYLKNKNIDVVLRIKESLNNLD